VRINQLYLFTSNGLKTNASTTLQTENFVTAVCTLFLV